MTSLLDASTSGKLFLLCSSQLLVVLLFLSSSCAHGASLVDDKVWGSESGSQRGMRVQPAPNVDMMKALEYIESLRQKTGPESQQHGPHSTGKDTGDVDDAERLRALIRLASAPARGTDEDKEQGEEEEEEGKEDKSEELLQAVLSTLQEADKASPPGSLHPAVEEGGARDGEYPRRPQKQQHGIPLHKKLPLMFEDEEEEEQGGAGEEEEGEGPGQKHDGHPKRTNENVEEKYTPQNLATLQSMFDELDRMTSVRTMSKRLEEQQEEENDDPEDGDEDEEEMFNVRNVAYDDVDRVLLPEWGFLKDQEIKDHDDEEEEEGNDKRDDDQDFDYVGNNKDETENDDDEEEEDESYPVKRSKDADDTANLVDYYLLKVLEKTEEEQKRELEEEEEEEEDEEEKQRAERRVSQSLYRDNVLPQNLYQIIKFSQKYRIPPEDVMNMLRAGQVRNQGRLQKVNKFSRLHNKFIPQIPPKNVHKIPDASFYARHPPYGQKSPEQLRTEEILKILGFDGAADRAPMREKTPYRGPLSRLHTQQVAAGRPGESTPRRFPTALKGRYDNALGEDELAAYLAAKLPSTQYLRPTYRARGQKRDDGGSFEQLVQDYFDHMDAGDKRPNEKRQPEPEGSYENEAVIKLLSYLSPEAAEENSDDAKTVEG